MKTRYWIVAMVVAALLGLLVLDQVIPRMAVRGIKVIKVGDDKRTVEKELGSPPCIYGAVAPSGNLITDMIFQRGEVWSYESLLKFQVPTSGDWCPVKINIMRLCPDADSVYVEFDGSGHVKAIHEPPP